MNRYLASALLLLWACSPNEPVEPEKPDPTPGKTTTDLTLSAAPFCGNWTKGDAVSVLDGNGNHRYTAQGDGRSVKFKGDASLDGKDIVVISPYSSTASIKDNTLTASEWQQFREVCVTPRHRKLYFIAHISPSLLRLYNRLCSSLR